jgi:hypothetical protein
MSILMSCGLYCANFSSVCRFVIYFGEILFCFGPDRKIQMAVCVVLLRSAMEVVMGTVVLLNALHFVYLFNVR